LGESRRKKDTSRGRATRRGEDEIPSANCSGHEKPRRPSKEVQPYSQSRRCPELSGKKGMANGMVGGPSGFPTFSRKKERKKTGKRSSA